MSWRAAYVCALVQQLGEVPRARLAREVGDAAVHEALRANTAPGTPLREAWRFTESGPVAVVYAP